MPQCSLAFFVNFFWLCSSILLQQDGTELFNFVHGHQSWPDYLRNMAANGTWGDHIILHAAANCFTTCIHVISSLSHDLTIHPEHDVSSSSQLVLGHLHEHHYVSLRPKPGRGTFKYVKQWQLTRFVYLTITSTEVYTPVVRRADTSFESDHIFVP